MKPFLFLICALIVCIYAETNIHFNFEGMIPELPVCGCGSVCGDGVCSADEDENICPNDCTIIQPECGDGSCGTGEDAFSCPEDCSRCGDGLCDNTESLTSCLPDCVACGDGICSAGFETLQTCPTDCSNICGNGACETGETNGNCPQDCQCAPQCDGRQCGEDGCGGSCGTCSTGQVCNNGVCQCQPSCTGRQCGDDGCGGSCGTCPTGQDCTNGICGCTPSCTGRQCGDNGCGGSCGTCSTGQVCNNGVCQCQPSCTGRQCGDDGCGGSCGTCPTGQDCTNGICNGCTPSCDGRECGNDGCGGSCGVCTSPETCVDGECVCSPSCTGRTCGTDGCGGSCGTCSTGQTCNSGGVCVQTGNTFTVAFTAYDVFGSGSIASGINITSSQGTAITGTEGTASLVISRNDPVISVSGNGYESATYELPVEISTFRLLVARTLSPSEVKVAATWSDGFVDLDLNLFGPGNTTLYGAATVGVVNWEYEEKQEGLPFALYTDRTGDFGLETIEISQLDGESNYEFMIFHWQRVGGNDDTKTFANAELYFFIWAGEGTPITSTMMAAIPPVAPAGFAHGFWQPLILEKDDFTSLLTVTEVDSFEPLVSQDDIINRVRLEWSCSYSYCPYTIPGL